MNTQKPVAFLYTYNEPSQRGNQKNSSTYDSIKKSKISLVVKTILSDFTHIWDLGNKTNEQRQKKKEKEKRHKPRNRLLTLENTLIVTRGDHGVLGEIDDGD